MEDPEIGINSKFGVIVYGDEKQDELLHGRQGE